MLIVGAIAGSEADLAERVIETRLFGDLRQLAVIVDIPAGTLLDRAITRPPDTFGTQ